MEYGDRLRAARNRKKWSQDVLAEKSGVGQGSISKIERGGQQVSAFDVELADALNVNPLWLKSGAKKYEPDWISDPTASSDSVKENVKEYSNTEKSDIANDISELFPVVTPRSHAVLEKLEKSLQAKKLTEDDMKIIEAIADRFTKE